MTTKKKMNTPIITNATYGSSSIIPTAVHASVIKEIEVSPSNRKKMQSSLKNKYDSKLGYPNEIELKKFLNSYYWSEGLQDALIRSCKKIAIRYIITDDSGSMMTNDGHRLIGTDLLKMKMIQCTRWSELVHSLKFHALLADAAQAPTEFRLLNNYEPIMVGNHEDTQHEGLRNALQIFEEESPSGQTPLCHHITEVIECIRQQENELRSTGRKACVVIATDGESTDGNLAEAMKPLQDLPVWVVIRLCTDEESVVEYWNNIDTQLELEMDVLDDLSGESVEVHQANPWVSYGDPLQKLREFGASIKEMDLLDESLLSSEQMRVLCSILVSDGDPKSLPHPDEDWLLFYNSLKSKNKAFKIWDPVTKGPKEWIDMKKLTMTYGDLKGSSSCSMM